MNSGVDGAKPENSGVNGVEMGEKWCQWRCTGKTAALTAFKRENSGFNGVEQEKKRGVNGVYAEKTGVNFVELDK